MTIKSRLPNDGWVRPRELQVKVADNYAFVQQGWTKVAGVWKKVYDKPKAVLLSGTSSGASGNNYHYETISNDQLTIQPGDRLTCDMRRTSSSRAIGIDARLFNSAGTFVQNMRDYVNPTTKDNVKDQNGIASHPAINLDNAPVDTWYPRIFDLTPIVGLTVREWGLALQDVSGGRHQAYFRNIKVIDALGQDRLTIFDQTLGQASLKTFGATTNQYSSISKTVVAAPT